MWWRQLWPGGGIQDWLSWVMHKGLGNADLLEHTLNLPLNESRPFFQNSDISLTANEKNYNNMWGGLTNGRGRRWKWDWKYLHLHISKWLTLVVGIKKHSKSIVSVKNMWDESEMCKRAMVCLYPLAPWQVKISQKMLTSMGKHYYPQGVGKFLSLWSPIYKILEMQCPSQKYIC